MLKPYPRELKKVAVAAVFCICNFIATAASLAIVHEYYPLIEPLPGKAKYIKQFYPDEVVPNPLTGKRNVSYPLVR